MRLFPIPKSPYQRIFIHLYLFLSSIFLKNSGNGKRHRIPLPVRPRKIKRITFEAFLDIKELLKKIKRPRAKIRRRYRKKPPVIYKITNDLAHYETRSYEPSKIGDTYNSRFWSWRRVIAWEKYINDPLEDKKGHKTMI